jgi:hypothetical protein
MSSSYASSRYNATKHGLSGRSALLPWENARELEALLDELEQEHEPRGPTECHLVGEIAAVMWRQRRVLQAEVARIREELEQRLDRWHDKRTVESALAHIGSEGDVSAAVSVRATEDDIRDQLADIGEDEAMTRKALRILRRAGPNAYNGAVAALRDGTREWWQELLEDGPEENGEANGEEEEGGGPYEPTPASLRAFLEEEMLPLFAERRTNIANRSVVREHALAAAAAHADLERTSRYETHLDRKLNRLLGTLLRLQEARRTINGVAEPSVSQKLGAEKALPRTSSELNRHREAQDVAA